MARNRQVTDIMADVRKRADVEAKVQRFPDAEVLEYVNQSISDLYDQLVRAKGADYFAIDATPIATNAVTVLFGLPADFFTLISVRLTTGTGQQVPLEPFTEVEEAILASQPVASDLFVPKYRLRGSVAAPDQLEVLPIVGNGKTLLVKYIPAAIRLSAVSIPPDSFDGYNGWEEFVILDAARKIATKDQKWDLVGNLRTDITKIESRIAALASKRDRGKPERVQDTRSARRWGRLIRRSTG